MKLEHQAIQLGWTCFPYIVSGVVFWRLIEHSAKHRARSWFGVDRGWYDLDFLVDFRLHWLFTSVLSVA
jgi:hypothetical protein